MMFRKRSNKDSLMKKATPLIAIQACIRRSCFVAREFTGIEVMPEEMGAASVASMSRLKKAWDSNGISNEKPESVVNYAVCMAVGEWALAVRRSDNTPTILNADVISSQFDLIGQTLEGLFPGIMGMKTASQNIYDAVCRSAEHFEKNGWNWTKKLNEPMVCLISLSLILNLMSKQSTKIYVLKEALELKEEGN